MLRLTPSCRRLLSSTVAALLLAPTLGPIAHAQQEGSTGVFGEVIDVRVVNLEVVVTDRKGNRVTGLAPGDFVLKVDGKEVPIDYFSEVQGGISVAPTGSQSVQGLPTLTPGAPVGTSYLVFVDDFFAVERDRNRVIDSLEQQLPLLTPEDRMAIVAFDGKKLAMLTSWSQSSRELGRALREARVRPAYGLQRLSEAKQLSSSRTVLRQAGFDPNPYSFPGGDITTRLSVEEKEFAERRSTQVQRVISAASATLRSFAMPPGRKVMMLLSGGWPFDPAQAAAEDASRPVLDEGFPRSTALYRPLIDTANLLGYTLYPVDVPGLIGNGPDASVEGVPAPQSGLESPELEAETSLTHIASRTGGKALLNALRVQALGQAATDTRSYYWLGFTPQRQRDDKPHKIAVDVRRDGLRVRSRRGFLDSSRRTEVSAMVESALLFGSAPASAALPVRLGEGKKGGRSLLDVPIEIAIPIDQITVVPVGDRYVSELELRVAVIDEDGWTSEIPVLPLKLEAPQQPVPGGHVRYATTIKLRKKKCDLVVAVYDVPSGRLVASRVQFQPPSH